MILPVSHLSVQQLNYIFCLHATVSITVAVIFVVQDGLRVLITRDVFITLLCLFLLVTIFVIITAMCLFARLRKRQKLAKPAEPLYSERYEYVQPDVYFR